MGISVKQGVAAALAAVTVTFAVAGLFGAWSQWDIGFLGDGKLDYKIGEVEFHGGGERESEAYPNDSALRGMFAITTTFLVIAALLGVLGVAAIAVDLLDVMVPPQLTRAARPLAWALPALAGVLLLVAAIHVMIAFPAAYADGEGDTGGDGPGETFWGEENGFTWGAGAAWYLAVAGGVFGVVAAVLARSAQTHA